MYFSAKSDSAPSANNATYRGRRNSQLAQAFVSDQETKGKKQEECKQQ